jgi:hypothetical protein
LFEQSHQVVNGTVAHSHVCVDEKEDITRGTLRPDEAVGESRTARFLPFAETHTCDEAATRTSQSAHRWSTTSHSHA